jgi:hypothetical protein
MVTAVKTSNLTKLTLRSWQYSDCSLLGVGIVWVLLEPAFRTNVSPHFQGKKISELVTANVVPGSLILSTMNKEAT